MIHLLTCLIVHAVTRISLAQDIPADITQSLVVLLQEEASVRAKLDRDLAQLSNELDTLKALKSNGKISSKD